MLLPVLRSETQARLLAAVLLHPQRESSIADLAREIGADPGNLHSDVQRLLTAGIFIDRRIGRIRLIRAADGPLVRPLQDLMLVAYGPKAVLEKALAGQPGLQQAIIFGSWAARYHGEPGLPPADVDLLVVGNPDRQHITDLAADASTALRRDVHIVFRTGRAWRSATDAFTRSVQSRPAVTLDLDRAAG